MWLIHNFFLTTNLAILIRVIKMAVVKYVALVIISCICSFVLNKIEIALGRLKMQKKQN